MASNILTECYVDTLLVETIVPDKKGHNHRFGCPNVLRTMKNKLTNEFALGIMDDDKAVPKDFCAFVLMKKYNRLALYKHNDKPHYVIKVSKAAEDFILHTARQCNISLADYDLPNDLENLKKKTKHITTKNNPDLKRLFSALKQNSLSDFYILAQWIELLRANPYTIPDDFIN